jgi:hypothetical protein
MIFRNRRGQIPSLVMKMALAVAIFLVVVTIVVVFKNRFTESTEDTISCGGLVGTLGGKDGKCMSQKTCEGEQPDEGYYYQYVGEGLGCPSDKADKYCCIQVSEGSNPLRASEVRAMRCQSMEAGTWAYSKNGVASCTPLPATIEIAVDEPITFYYKPKPEDQDKCGVKFSFSPTLITLTKMSRDGFSCYGSINEGTGVVEITTTILQAYDAANADKSRLNQHQIADSIQLIPGSASVGVAIRNVNGNTLKYTFCSAQSELYCRKAYVGEMAKGVYDFPYTDGSGRTYKTMISGECILRSGTRDVCDMPQKQSTPGGG